MLLGTLEETKEGSREANEGWPPEAGEGIPDGAAELSKLLGTLLPSLMLLSLRAEAAAEDVAARPRMDDRRDALEDSVRSECGWSAFSLADI